MSQKSTETVEMINDYGAVARPEKADEAIWLAAGWKRVAPKTDTKEKLNG